MEMTPRDVEDRLEEAALTLRRLPNPAGSGPKGYGSSWPDYVQEARHAYGYTEARMRVIPSAKEIQQMEEAIAWLMFVRDATDRRILWMRAEGWRWRAVCNAAGCARATAWRRWTAGLITVANQLNRKEKKARAARAAKIAADGGA